MGLCDMCYVFYRLYYQRLTLESWFIISKTNYERMTGQPNDGRIETRQ